MLMTLFSVTPLLVGISVLSTLLVVLSQLLAVAFFTLLERKTLSLSQTRLGPTKVGLGGLIQPPMDGVKLILKTEVSTLSLVLVPSSFLFLSLIGWSLVDSNLGIHYTLLGGLAVLGVLGLLVYSTLLVGVLSEASFSVLGGVRAASQSISYEVVFSVVIISLLMMSSSFVLSAGHSWGWILSVLFVWCMLAETNRAPLDFSEGESELISGFNLETGGVIFTLLFLGEYASLLFLLSLGCKMLFPGFVGVAVFMSLYVINLIRCSFPRLRYDLLMGVCWSLLLPVSVGLLWGVDSVSI